MSKTDSIFKRRKRIRAKIKSKLNLRLSAFRSSKHIYIQVIDDKTGKTLMAASSHDKDFKDQKLKPKEIAFKVGEKLGDMIKEKKFNQSFTFDRSGYLYHGRVKELAMGVRSKGIKF